MSSESDLGQPLPPDDPSEDVVVSSSGMEDMTDEALEAAIARGGVEITDPLAEDDVPAQETAVASEPQSAVVPAVEAEAEIVAPAEQAEPEPVDVVSELQRERLEREKLAAKLELQQAHNSRLAGEIGFLKQRAVARPEPSEPDAYALDDRGSESPESKQLWERIDKLEGRIAAGAVEDVTQGAVVAAMNEFTASVTDPKERAELDRHIKAVVPNYAKDWQAAKAQRDPEIAGALARGMIMNVIADAKIARLNESRDAARQERAAGAVALRRSKMAAAPTRTTGAPPQTSRPRAKSPDQMSDQELEAALAPLG